MEYMLLHGKEAETVKNYMPEDIWEGFEKYEYRYALCSVEDDKLTGVAVFDALSAAQIVSVRVLEGYRGKTETELFENIGEICSRLGCDGIVYEIYDEDDPEFFGPILTKAGFEEGDTVTLYKFPIMAIYENAIISKAKVGKNIISLSRASDKSRRLYANKLIKSESYDKFMDGGFQEDLSTLYVDEKGNIMACLLIRDMGPEEGFSIEYANSEGCNDKTAFLQLLKQSAYNILNYYTQDDLSGYVLVMNAMTEGLVRKIIPEAKEEDHCTTYVKVL